MTNAHAKFFVGENVHKWQIRQIINQSLTPSTDMTDTTHFDFEDEYHVNHCQQQAYSGLHQPR